MNRNRSSCSLTASMLIGVCSLLSASHADAQSRKNKKQDDDRLPVLQMLAEGSILQDAIIPSYDESLRLSSLLRAEKLVLIDQETIEATKATIEFFKPDESHEGRIDLKTATLYDQRMLHSKEPVTILTENFDAHGSALAYDLETSQGFLHGPTESRFSTDQRSAMIDLPTLRPGGLAGITLMAAAGLQAASLDALTEEETAGLDRIAESQGEKLEEGAKNIEEQLEETDAQGAEADQSLRKFLKKAKVEQPKGKPVDLTSKVPDPEPSEIAKKPAKVTSEDGVYFDSVSGHLVFLKNVHVDHPEFILSGADELKVFMEKEEPKVPTEDTNSTTVVEADGDGLGNANFGEPTHIVATGTVVIVRKAVGDQKKAKASGRQVVMDLRTDELIIRGGEPWIISDTASGRVIDPNGYIRLNVETGDATFVGRSKGFIETDKPNQPNKRNADKP